MSSRRVLLFSFGMALLLTCISSLLYLGSQRMEQVPLIVWVIAMAITCFVAIATAIYLNFTLRIRSIQRKILESSDQPMLGFDQNMTLEKLEESVDEWSSRQKKLIQELESREEFRREYIGNVSHELKTPIFNIQGYILTLLDGAKDDPKITTKFLKRAAKSVDRMTSLVKDMDVLSKVETGRYDIRLVPTRLDLLIDDTLLGIDSFAANYSAKIKVKYSCQKSQVVLCDTAKIEQVLDNLIVNAIKYSEEPRSVKIVLEDAGTKINISVVDNGFGIPEKDIHRIFERFYRVDKARSREAGGSGLGLSIVKHIIDRHSESIEVHSEEGVGTTFRFTLTKA